MSSKDSGPGVKVPPPLIFISFALLGYLLEQVYSLQLISGDVSVLLLCSYVIFSLGIIVIFLAVISFFRHKTHIEPWQPASALMTEGIFAYSRNPIYLGFVVLVVAAALYLNTFWLLIGLLPSIWLLIHLVLQKEEQYLAQKFGAAYLAYKSRVRRWL